MLRHDVPKDDKAQIKTLVPAVKALIKAAFDADPTKVKAVFLFGHLPVPAPVPAAPANLQAL